MTPTLTPQERAALERLRKPIGDADYVCPVQRYEDTGLCIAALLRLCPGDDGKLLDIDWLNSLSHDAGDMSFLCVRLCDDRTLRLVAFRDFVSQRPSTRGDVRRLAESLGIELKEASK